MAMVTPVADALDEGEHRGHLLRAVIASTIGTTIEWYDFFLYGTVTGLVFAKLYFPNSDPLVGTLQAYAVFFVGFVARPVGAAIFGHYGDRIGRKSALIATLLLTGLATFAVALVPTYEQIGIWGARAADRAALHPRCRRGRRVERLGAAVDGMGEDQRASRLHRLMAAVRRRRAVWSLPTSAVLAFSAISGDQFLTWGWRIPFLLEHRHGRDRALHPARDPRDAGFRTYGLGEERIERAPVNRSDQAPAEGDHPVGIRPDGGASTWIHLTSPTSSPMARRCWRSRAISCSSGCWPAQSCHCSGFRSPGIYRIASAANACT